MSTTTLPPAQDKTAPVSAPAGKAGISDRAKAERKLGYMLCAPAVIVMLAVTGGRERSPSQLAKLLNSAGLKLSTVVDTTGPMRIVEATIA